MNTKIGDKRGGIRELTHNISSATISARMKKKRATNIWQTMLRGGGGGAETTLKSQLHDMHV